MTEQQKPKAPTNPAHHNVPSSTSSTSRVSGEISSSNKAAAGPKPHYPNPPDAANPDPATLRDQWKYATRQYGKWYSHAWGTAILAGISFFALGWIIKGSNPLPSKQEDHLRSPPPDASPDHR